MYAYVMHMYTHTYVYIYIHICTHIYVHIYIYVQICDQKEVQRGTHDMRRTVAGVLRAMSAKAASPVRSASRFGTWFCFSVWVWV